MPPRRLLLALLIASLSASAVLGQEWTRFRGPNGAGASDATTIPAEFTEKDYNWKVSLPGIGHSSPVLWGDSLFITTGDPKTGDQIALGINSGDGKILWQRALKSAPGPLHQRNSYATSSPAVDEERVYIAWASPESYRVAALTHAGEPVWEVDLGPFKSQHGYGASPIVFGDLVVLNNDQDGESSLVALDRRSGAERWKVPRKTGTVAYSTPCVHTPSGGQPELIFNSNSHGISGIDPLTGKTNWELAAFDKRSCSSPIIVDNLIFGSCGSGGGGNYVVAVKPGNSQGATPEIAFKLTKSAPYVPSPVSRGDLVFCWSDAGVLSCLELPSGNPLWQNRVPGNYSGSPVIAGDKIYCINEDGEVIVVAADREFQLLGRNPLGDHSRSTPAVAGGRMFLRTEKTLVSVGGKK